MSELCEPTRKRRRIKIRVDLHEWIDEQVQNGKFQSFSHVIETALEKLKDTETQTKQPTPNHQQIKTPLTKPTKHPHTATQQITTKHSQTTPDNDLHNWSTKQIKEMKYGSYSHAINHALKQILNHFRDKAARLTEDRIVVTKRNFVLSLFCLNRRLLSDLS